MSRIDTLTLALREAGLGKFSTPFYGSCFHSESHNYHLHGDTWPKERLHVSGRIQIIRDQQAGITKETGYTPCGI